MKKSRFTEEQIIGFLKRAEAGTPIKELCRNGGFSDATFHKWSGGPTQHESYSRRVEFSTELGEGKAPAWMLGFARRPLKAMALRTLHVGWT